MPKLVTGMQTEADHVTYAALSPPELKRRALNCFWSGAQQPFNHKHAKGFTLTELLVVIVIIGVTLSFALLAFGDFGNKRRLIVAAEQFVYQVQLAQQQAILESSTLSIEIKDDHYQVMRFSSTKGWRQFAHQSLFQQQYFPRGTLTNLFIQNKNKRIIINPSGETTPFDLNLGSEVKPNFVQVHGDLNGEMFVKITDDA